MIGVAKVVIIDDTNKYLLLERSDHPTLFNDADLPGGVIEPGESPAKALVREVQEETGIEMPESAMHQIYKGSDYSEHGTVYYLFTATLPERPLLTISWEHAATNGWTAKNFYTEPKLQPTPTCTWFTTFYIEQKNNKQGTQLQTASLRLIESLMCAGDRTINICRQCWGT